QSSAMAVELTQDAVLYFLQSRGGSVTNAELLLHFRPFLREHADRDRNREIFKRFVNSVARVKQEDGVSYVVLQRKFRGHGQVVGPGVSGPSKEAPLTASTPSNVHLSSLWNVDKPRNKCPEPGPAQGPLILPAAGIILNNNNNNSVEPNLNLPQRRVSPSPAPGPSPGPSPDPPPDPLPDPPPDSLPDPLPDPLLHTRPSRSSTDALRLPAMPSLCPPRRKDTRGSLKNRSSGPCTLVQFVTLLSPVVPCVQSQVPLEQREHLWLVKAAEGMWPDIYSLFREEPSLLHRRDFISGFTVLHWIAKHGDHRVLNTL
ncbi:hypothetical protein NL108_011607, partial [Boleophthalmus pectinirostris]